MFGIRPGIILPRPLFMPFRGNQFSGFGGRQLASAYVANNGAAFNGTDDYLTGPVSGTFSDSVYMLFSAWVYLDNPASFNTYRIASWQHNRSLRLEAYWQSGIGGRVFLHLKTIGDSTLVSGTTANGSFPIDEWVHIAAWADLSAGTPECEIYINGVDETPTWATGPVAGDIGWGLGSGSDTYWGTNGTAGGQFWKGYIQELYLNTTERFDLGSGSNIDSFISGGKPVDLGSNGSTPTGSQPKVYLNDPYDTWETNYGSMGDFTDVNVLTEAPSSPSD